MNDGRSIAKLAGAVVACEAAGGIGDFLSRDGLREWYPKLEKPSFTPPGSDFGPAWGLLYALMGGRNKTQKEPAPAAVHRRG